MSDLLNPLGEFLRARRELVTPQQAGIEADGSGRSVPGLRREEVAMLAGISADYYLRLERGRDRNPSRQVLQALARVLKLDDEHFAHMLSLGIQAPRRARAPRRAVVPSGAMKLLESLTQPAFIEARHFDIVAANRLAAALSPGLQIGSNQLRDLFLDPEVQAFHPDWRNVTECFVANLRQLVGTDFDDPRFIELTGQLSLGSPRFRRLWARHEMRGQSGTMIRIDHPLVGEMIFSREQLAIAGTDSLMLVIYHPDSGSSDADKLSLLASAELPPMTNEPVRTVA